MSIPVPPFKRAAPAREPIRFVPSLPLDVASPVPEAEQSINVSTMRRRLADLDSHLHCSVIGTCLSTGELRKALSHHLDLQDADDLTVHHEAVHRLAGAGPLVRALHKALDQKHGAAIRQAALLRGDSALRDWWKAALERGDVPGAYWAVLTHRDADADLVKQVFGDVHMLSHLVGSANRADLRRLATLERERGDLHRGLDAEREASRAIRETLEQRIASLERSLVDGREARDRAVADVQSRWQRRVAAADAAASSVALRAARDRRLEREADDARTEVLVSRRALDEARRKVDELQAELSVIEDLHCSPADCHDRSAATGRLHGRRILYVGGRPASTRSIRDFVVRHGGTFASHDGGLDDRKGLLAPAVAGADVVLFPVDCIDHDAAGRVKRLCVKLRIPFVPLRSAGIASFAATMLQRDFAG